MRHKILTPLIAAVWLVNGLLCKVLGFVPRHKAIVAGILGKGPAGLITKAIGFGEILMAAWIVSGVLARMAAITQIVLVAAMNILEALLTPGLLLFGRGNAFFALLFIGVIYGHYALLNNKPAQHS